MFTELEGRLSEVVADRQHQLQLIIENSCDPEIRIRARTVLDRDQEIAEILNLLKRD
jgi:hypothetical protein